MPNIVLYSNYRFYINGQLVNPPIDWMDMAILATFENDSPEANITTTGITFVNEEAVLIRNWIAGGVTGATDGIFQGIPFKIQVANSSNVFDTFEGYLDLTDDFSEISPVKVTCKIAKIAGINNFSERAEGVTYNYLEELGVFTSADYTDCPYVREREFEFLEFAMLSLTTFLLGRELADTIRRLSTDIANIVAHTTGGATGPAAAAIYAIAVAALNIIYAALMVIYLLQLIRELISYLFNPTRIHKGITLRKALEKACNHMGYMFSSSITDLDDVVYLPTKSKPGRLAPIFNTPIMPSLGAVGRGLPNSGDYGYTVGEMFKIAIDCFDARLTIRKINGSDTVCLEPVKNTAFWVPSAGYTLPDILDEEKSYNTEDLKANRLISFALDLNDDYTLTNYRGNSYEIITDAITCQDQRMKRLKGLEEVRIPCALPTRKAGLTDFEQVLKTVAQVADSVINFFGGNSSLANYITNRVGMIKVSTDIIQVPKLVKYAGGTLPANYRDIWGAKYLEDTYHHRKSFKRNNYGNQYRKFADRNIPFGFTGFLALINYGACAIATGGVAEFKSIEWVLSSDKARAHFKKKEIYTKNLTETFREEADNAEGSV